MDSNSIAWFWPLEAYVYVELYLSFIRSRIPMHVLNTTIPNIG